MDGREGGLGVCVWLRIGEKVHRQQIGPREIYKPIQNKWPVSDETESVQV